MKRLTRMSLAAILAGATCIVEKGKPLLVLAK
jgi:hypothetical protein